MVPGISMVVRISRLVTVIKKEQNELKFLIKTKQKTLKKVHVLDKIATVCSLFVFDSHSNTFACKASRDFCMYGNRMLSALPREFRFS